jgi:hypothetical protein
MRPAIERGSAAMSSLLEAEANSFVEKPAPIFTGE